MPTYKLRVVEKTEDGGTIRLVCEDEDAAVYSVTVSGGTSSADPQVDPGLQLRGPTWLEVIDAPLLTTANGDAAIFLAAGSVLDNWPGAVIYRSTDGGATFEDVATITQRATVGTAYTRLSPWFGGNVLDNCSSVIVDVHGGDLSSTTWAGLLGGANLCALGNEVLQFRTATQVSPGRWALTDFLRHYGGTERFGLAHAPGERFVLLERAAVVPLGSDQVGRQVIYRAVTSGSPVTAGTDITVTENHEALKPRDPVHLSVGRSTPAAGYIARWTRRTRVPAPWVDGADAPVDDAPVRFRVRVSHGPVADVDTIVTEPEVAFGAGLDFTFYTLEVSQISNSSAVGYSARVSIT
jgi:hypothetical protein